MSTTQRAFTGNRPAQKDFYIKQGAYWSPSIAIQNNDGTPKDISGHAFKMQIRETYEGEVIAELSSSASSILVNESTATITPTLTSDQTAELSFTKAVYDIFDYPPSGNDWTVLEGQIELGKRVTQ